MIIVNLKGGLGNQMFQYACGRALSLRAKARGESGTLRLDATGFDRVNAMPGTVTRRSYELGAFNVQARLATPEEIKCVKYPFGILSKAWRYFSAKGLRKFHIAFEEKTFGHNDRIYLDGYWQTEKYFRDHEAAIRNDFTLAKPPGEAAMRQFKAIAKARHSVSLHIRRGDYVTDSATAGHHGSCGKDYYERAVVEMAQMLNQRGPSRGARGKAKEAVAIPNIFVFSDDIAWAKANLSFPCPISFVSSPDLTSAEELALMSSCKHHVIANSTFSWWGAWLGQNADKIVMAPKRWAQEHDEDWYADIIPESWIRI
ncbi:MAG: alpha-1,2-fucosyltransferase [Candidatus Paceibacterota bacterium]|jgi:hypothetical protein